MPSHLLSRAPHPGLRPYVARVVGYREQGVPAGVHRGLPSPHLTLVLTVDAPLVVLAHPGPEQAPDAYDALVGGLHTSPALLAHPGHQWGVQLDLTPLGARALLGVPAGALASYDVHLSELLGGRAAELVERVRAAPDERRRLDAVELALLRAVRPDAALAPEVSRAWHLTMAGGGRLRVGQVAQDVGWSTRHLGERFRAEFGLTLKQAARFARFDSARRRLAGRVGAGRPADLAGLAAACGYADQAHLTREWRALAGLPPSAWLGEQLANVQDGDLVGGQPAGHDH